MGCCQENNDSFLIRTISSKADSFTLISSGSKFNNKTYHGFWHEKVRHKNDPEIHVVDNSSLLQFYCQWIDLNHLAYKPGYFLETYGQ